MASAQPIARYLNEPLQKPSLHLDVLASQSTSASRYPATFMPPQSASSASSSRRSSASDGRTEISTAPTSATSITTSPTIDSALLYDRMEPPQYWLQCTFIELGCKYQFYPEDSAAWKSHVLSHFVGKYPPPNDCLCIFCSKEFRGENGWSKRMSHIKEHLANGYRIEEHSRPDFAVCRYMYRNGLMSEADYNVWRQYSETPGNDLGLKPSNYQPEKSAYRDDVVCYDQRKEDRERKAHRSRKGKARESTRHHRSS